MKNIPKSGLFLLLLIASLFVFGCVDPLELNKSKTPVGYGTISITVMEGEQMARTAFPTIPAYHKYEYTFTKEGNAAGTKRESNDNGHFTLEVGTYTVTVHAYFSDADSHTLAAHGTSAAFSVHHEGHTPVEVRLSPFDTAGEGQGKFIYTITYPAGAEGEITLQHWPVMNTIALDPVDVPNGSGKTQTLELDAGYYLLTILVSDGSFNYAGKNEVVHIYPGLETIYTKNFEQKDMLPAETISAVELTLTAPVKNAIPMAVASGAGNFTIGEVTWSPADAPFLGNVSYTATVTLTANNRYIFNIASATLNGQPMNGSGGINSKTVTLSYTFTQTDDRVVDSIAIKTPPNNLVYTHGDTLNLTGLVVTLTHDDNTTEDVDAADFADKHITAAPSHENHLVHMTHNGHPVTITYGNLTAFTDPLVVNKALGTFHHHSAIDTVYSPTLSLSDLNAQLGNGYAWRSPSISLEAGNEQVFDADYTDPSGNFTMVSGEITVNVAKAAGAAVDAPPDASSVTVDSITITAVPPPASGQTVEYAISTADAAPETGWQDSAEFLDLDKGTTYYIFARSQENKNYNTGVASGALPVATLQTVSDNLFEYYWVNEYGILVTTTNNLTAINPGTTLTITAAGVGYVVKQWHLNGVNTGESGNTYAFSNVMAGNYTVGLFVEKDGIPYNTNIIIKVNTVTVTFNTNSATSGTGPAAVQSVSAGTFITLPLRGSLARTGYTFLGWNTNSSGTGTHYDAGSEYTVPAAASTTLYAEWKRNVTVNFSANGGTGTVASLQKFTGDIITLPNGSGFSREGFAFIGWSSNSLGTGTNYSVGTSYTVPNADSATLYARWLQGTRAITIDMYSTDYGWSNDGGLRIFVNGTQRSLIRLNTGYFGITSFAVEPGDVVEFRWNVDTSNFSSTQTLNYQSGYSFIAYYSDMPPDPPFYTGDRNGGGPSIWSGDNALVYKLRGPSYGATGSNYLTGVANNTLLGSFTVP